jgi:GT2 family glycosyltransferase
VAAVTVPAFVIHWKAPQWCEATVASLQNSTVPVKVTVLDNSGDYAGPGEVKQLTRNLGYAGAANLALRSAAANSDEWCVIACHDALAAPDAVEKLLSVAREPYAVLGAVLDGAVPPWVASEEQDGVVPAGTVIGTLMLVNVPAALAVGGFDERYHSYFEEVDLCHRLWIAGHRTGFVPGAHVETKGSASPSAEALKKGNYVLLTLKEGGTRPALTELGCLGSEALTQMVTWVTTGRAEQRGLTTAAAHGFALGLVNILRYWRLASTQPVSGILPE